MQKTSYKGATPYTAADGTLVRELFHPELHGHAPVSLCENVVAPLSTTALFGHPSSDKICHVLEGRGAMRVGDRIFPVQARDTIFIPRNTPHQVENSGDCFLRLLFFFSPPQIHRETVFEKPGGAG